MKDLRMSEPLSGIGFAVTAKAVPAAASLCGTLGVFAGICAVVPMIFGPNITLIELVAGFFGTLAFYHKHYRAGIHAGGPLSTLVSAMINLFATLWMLQAAYSLVSANTDIVLHQAAVSGLAFGVAYAMQNLLTRLLSLVEQIKWPWAKGEGAP